MSYSMSPSLTLGPYARAEGRVALPGSKSISNRTLLLAALAKGTTTLFGLLASDDTDRMLEALTKLGVRIEHDHASGACVVQGTAGRFATRTSNLFLGNAGTAFRPLTAVLAMLGGEHELHGAARMHERPIGDLVDALRQAGCEVRYLAQDGFPPLVVEGNGGSAGRHIRIRGDVSSQFLSALLLALPLAQGSATSATTIEVVTPLISRPYVDITRSLMARFGVLVATPDESTFVVPAGASYVSPGTVQVEGDASTASYFLAAGVLGGGPVRVLGVGRSSIQGDVEFAHVLARQGATIAFDADWIEARQGAPLQGGVIECVRIPDAAMTLAVMALFARAPTRLIDIGSWRVKETDRIAAMAIELRKLGATVDEGDDWLEIHPLTAFQAATIDTYDDHRMAMCFSLATFGGVAITINDPACVRKTFPAYFEAFSEIVHA